MVVMPISQILRTLDSLGLSYALIGGRALIARGYVRFTVDFDFLTTDKRVLETSSWAALEGSQVDFRTGDDDDPFRGVAQIRLAGGEEADVLVGWRWEQAAIDRAERIAFDSLSIPVPRVSDLVLLKLAAGGSLDLSDIANLLEIYGDGLITEVEAHIDDVQPDVRQTWMDLLAARQR
jgi:hypothetical protein